MCHKGCLWPFIIISKQTTLPSNDVGYITELEIQNLNQFQSLPIQQFNGPINDPNLSILAAFCSKSLARHGL